MALKSVVFLCLVANGLLFSAPPQKTMEDLYALERAPFSPPEDLYVRQARIISEGTPISADVYSLKSLKGKKLPTVIMCHGYTGTAAMLRPQAVDLAHAAYLVVVIDYRGWGGSEGRLIPSKPAPVERSGNPFMAEVRELRRTVDPLDEALDLQNAIHWVQGEPQCETSRIGLWGSSYSGGLVIYVAARDSRVKALVSQVPVIPDRSTDPEALSAMYMSATKRARAEIAYPAPDATTVYRHGDTVATFRGSSIAEKELYYAPMADIANAPQCAMLFLPAKDEDLIDNRLHAIKALARAVGPKKLVFLPGTHFSAYFEDRGLAMQQSIDWFDRYLKD